MTVLEQTSVLTEVGASLQLGPNATRLVAALELLPVVRPVASRPDAIQFLRWEDGSVLLQAEHGDAAERYFGVPELDFFRPDLQRALVGALPPAVRLRLGAKATGLEEVGERVDVVLESGERVRADGVVAADGVRSRLRQLLVGPEDPVFSGTVVYRGAIPREHAADLHPDRVNRYWLGPDRHGVSYWISAGRLLALNLAVRDAEWGEESWTIEVPAAEALPYVEGWHEPLLERIRRCERVLRGAVYVRTPLEHWSFGRVTLLGDAAHAMTPFQAQGAAQAVEDAFVLGECVAAADGDLPTAFERYESIRMGRAGEVQQAGSTTGDELFLPDGPEQQARDAAYARLAETQPFGIRQRVWEYDLRTALAAATPS